MRPPRRDPKIPFRTLPTERCAHAELPRVSAGYPPPRASLPTCSSPVRHVSGPKTTPFDLHALGTPPALILSQDQTLHHCPIVCRPAPIGSSGHHPDRSPDQTDFLICPHLHTRARPTPRRSARTDPQDAAATTVRYSVFRA